MGVPTECVNQIEMMLPRGNPTSVTSQIANHLRLSSGLSY